MEFWLTKPFELQALSYLYNKYKNDEILRKFYSIRLLCQPINLLEQDEAAYVVKFFVENYTFAAVLNACGIQDITNYDTSNYAQNLNTIRLHIQEKTDICY
jgi:hypothetical protein